MYDNHTLFVYSGSVTAEDLLEFCHQSLERYRADIDDPSYACDFRVQIVNDKEGNSLKMGFIFVSNPEVYHMLLGNRPDGSRNVSLVDDSTWSAATVVEDPRWKDFDVKKCRDWVTATEYERYKDRLETTPVCPKIEVSLPTLMTLSDGTDDFYVDRALARDLDHNRSADTLKCRNVPMWITKEDIKQVVDFYSSNPNYPVVYFSANRTLFISYDPKTTDASFALHMIRKITLKADDKTAVLYFDHGFTHDKDDDRKAGRRTDERKPHGERRGGRGERTDRGTVGRSQDRPSREGRESRESRESREGREGRQSRESYHPSARLRDTRAIYPAAGIEGEATSSNRVAKTFKSVSTASAKSENKNILVASNLYDSLDM